MEKKLTITRQDIFKIKDFSYNHLRDTFPKNLGHDELQILLICKGLLDFLGYNNINLPVKIEYDWDKHNVPK